MRPRDGRRIEEVVGGRPLATGTPRAQIYTAYGYPSNFADAQRMWECRGGYAGDDPRPIPGGPPPIGMGVRHDHRGERRRLGRRGSANWSRSRASATSRRPGFLYGPYLKAKAARLVARSG